MRCKSSLLPTLVTVVVMSAGCASSPPYGSYPDGCSGVPGDDASPPWALAHEQATHGPGSLGRAVELTAVSRPPWPWNGALPPLYVFDDRGGPETRFRNPHTLLDAPAFASAETKAYWHEGVDGGIYQVPEFGACDLAAMLDQTLSVRAPQGGLLFFQFIIAQPCTTCDEITSAIDTLIHAHPTLPVRWIRVLVPPSIGKVDVVESSSRVLPNIAMMDAGGWQW